LKQPQYKPMLVEEQVVVLFAAVNGLLDTVAVEKIQDAENKILTAVKGRGKEILKKIADTGDFDEKDAEKLKKMISEALSVYQTIEEVEEKNNG